MVRRDSYLRLKVHTFTLRRIVEVDNSLWAMSAMLLRSVLLSFVCSRRRVCVGARWKQAKEWRPLGSNLFVVSPCDQSSSELPPCFECAISRSVPKHQPFSAQLLSRPAHDRAINNPQTPLRQPTLHHPPHVCPLKLGGVSRLNSDPRTIS